MSRKDVDAELVTRVQRGDKRAFDLLVLKYQRRIMRLLGRMVRDVDEVEDLAQETFIKAYRAIGQFRGDSAFYTWLYRIAINTARNWQTQQYRRPQTVTPFENEEGETFDQLDNLTDISTPGSILFSKQVAQTIEQTMDNLPDELRTALELREVEGMTYEEIAQAMDCPIGTVRSRIFRAREAVANALRALREGGAV
ncbi:MAG TPA: RNA polymerase sigma factor RpoE [Paenalcaligenes sp.]|nr:RNA polymerase sigma factor RpoE [Paenalcaligenes sp.]